MSHPHSHRFLFLITCLAAVGFLLITPAAVDAEVKRPPLTVQDKVGNTQKYCEGGGGTFTVRGTADRAITECQKDDGGYTTCLLTPTGTECHSLEVDIRLGDEGDQFPIDLFDDPTRNDFTPLGQFRHMLA